MLGYLYTMTATMLVVFYVAVVVTVNALLRWLFGIEVDLQTRQALATGLGLVVVTGPLWGLHWRGLCWQVDLEASPTVQSRYRTYLSVVAGVLLFTIFLCAGASVTVFMRLALGLLPDVTAGWVQGLPWLVALMTASVIWWLHWQPLFSHRASRIAQPPNKPQPGRLVTAQRGVSG